MGRHPLIPPMQPLATHMMLGDAVDLATAVAKKKAEDKLKSMCKEHGQDPATCERLIAAGAAIKDGDFDTFADTMMVAGVSAACGVVSPALAPICGMGAAWYKSWLDDWAKNPDIDPDRIRWELPFSLNDDPRDQANGEGVWISGTAYRQDPFARDQVGMRADVQRKEDLQPGEFWLEQFKTAHPLEVFFPDVGVSFKLTPELSAYKGWYRTWDGDLVYKEATRPTVALPADLVSPPVITPGTIYSGPGWADLMKVIKANAYRAPVQPPTFTRFHTRQTLIPQQTFATGYSKGTVAVFDPETGKYYLVSPT